MRAEVALGISWQEADALDLWHALTESGADGQSRLELREAGVSAHRIETLYPTDFENLVPEIIDLTGYALLPELEVASWQVVSFASRSLRSGLVDPLASEMYRSRYDYMRQPAYSTLVNHLRTCLPAERSAEAGVRQDNLWQAHWLMTHVSELDEAMAERARNYFCDVVAWTLPELHTTAFTRSLPAHA